MIKTVEKQRLTLIALWHVF